jgi:hypothetical protein
MYKLFISFLNLTNRFNEIINITLWFICCYLKNEYPDKSGKVIQGIES